MNTFGSGDRVVVNNQLPQLAGQGGTVTDPEHLGYVMVDMDDPELRREAIGCFLPEELDQPS